MSTRGGDGAGQPSTSSAAAQEQPAGAEPPKRGRGRPRKQPQVSSPSTCAPPAARPGHTRRGERGRAGLPACRGRVRAGSRSLRAGGLAPRSPLCAGQGGLRALGGGESRRRRRAARGRSRARVSAGVRACARGGAPAPLPGAAQRGPRRRRALRGPRWGRGDRRPGTPPPPTPRQPGRAGQRRAALGGLPRAFPAGGRFYAWSREPCWGRGGRGAALPRMRPIKPALAAPQSPRGGSAAGSVCLEGLPLPRKSRSALGAASQVHFKLTSASGRAGGRGREKVDFIH